MAKREPLRRKRRAGAARVPESRSSTGQAQAPSPVADDGPGRAGLEARLAFAFGVMAFLALPISYQWTFRPASRPPGSDVLVQLLELGGILAAAAALLLGRRARAAGDRTSGAVWGPRLGGAAIVGYVMVLFALLSGGG
jgi:hypothetical protein